MKLFVNLLTMIRIISTIFIPLAWEKMDAKVFIWFVAFILLTDFFDGILARTFKVQSLFGSIIDTIADKFFGVMLLLVITINQKSSINLYIIVLILELLIALVNIAGGLKGATTKSSFLGKTKTWFLGITTIVGLLFINENFTNVLANLSSFNSINDNKDLIIVASIFITVGTQVMVLIDYLKHIIKEIIINKPVVVFKFKEKKDLLFVLFDTDYYLKNKDKPLSQCILK